MPNLRLQGSTYHARLVVPKDVRKKFQNKSELSESLGTGNFKLAKVRGAEVVAAWKRQIHLARDGVNHREWAKDWAKEYRVAEATPEAKDQPSARDHIESIMIDELQELVDQGELEQESARQAFEIAIGHRIFLSDHRDDFLKQYSNHSVKTQAAYSAALAHFLDRFKESTEVSTKAVKMWLNHLVEEKGLGQETIGRLLRQAQAFWEYLIEHEVMPRDANPFQGVKLSVPKTATRSNPIKPFRPEEVVAILKSPKAEADEQLTLLIKLGMYTGARIEELAMLKWADVDLNEALISIHGTKTQAARRDVPLHPVLTSLLASLQDSAAGDFVIPGLTIDSRGERGKALGKRFGRLKTEMGYTGRDKVFHSIRKTVATLFEQSGVLEGVAADILGHEKQTMTYGLYSGGTSLTQKRDAIDKIGYGLK